MPYFKTIFITASQPNFAQVAEMTKNALNNYINYGQPWTSQPPEGMTKLPMQRVVKEVEPIQTVHNGTIYNTIILCCDGEEY